MEPNTMATRPTLGIAIAMAAVGAHADLSIPIPAANAATRYGVSLDTASTAASTIRNLTGAVYFKGAASSASLSENSDSSLTLKYSLVYSPADGPWNTTAGVLLPLTPEWDVKDLSEMTSITFEVKVATPGLKVALHIGSDAYPVDMLMEGSDLVSNNSSSLSGTYQTVTVRPEDLLPPTWSKAVGSIYTGWIADGVVYTTGIAPYVKDLNFQPVVDYAWNSTGTGFLTTTNAQIQVANSVSIRRVVVHGVSKYPRIQGTGCYGRSFVVEDFSSMDLYSHQPRPTGAPNYLGGYWYASSDTSSDTARAGDSTVGASKILLPAGASVWTPFANSAAVLNAQLEKTLPNGVYHKSAGWAVLGTDLFGSDGVSSLDLTSSPYGSVATGVGFDLYAGPQVASILAGAAMDTTKVVRIVFSVSTQSTPADAPYSVSIPLSQVLQFGGGSVCVDFAQMRQPSWYEREMGQMPLYPTDLTGLSWKIQIEDPNDPSIHTSGPNAIAVTNVKFWGVDSSDLFPNGMVNPPVDTTVVPPVDTTVKPPVDTIPVRHHHRNHRYDHPKPHHFPRFEAFYRHGLQVFYPDLRLGGLIEVKRQNGSTVGSFQVQAGSIGKMLPLTLQRGTYLVSLRLPGHRETLVVHVD
jgi:hypothetical protein